VWLDARPTGDGVEIALRDDFRNPWGIMHGGVTSAVVDAAARAVAADANASFDPQIAPSNDALHVDDVVIHFVAPARVGPVRAACEVLAQRPDGALVRVSVRDAGADDRVVAFAVATVG
jgi:acyl-coenzyme A thioesterase PaaI-like protein